MAAFSALGAGLSMMVSVDVLIIENPRINAAFTHLHQCGPQILKPPPCPVKQLPNTIARFLVELIISVSIPSWLMQISSYSWLSPMHVPSCF